MQSTLGRPSKANHLVDDGERDVKAIIKREKLNLSDLDPKRKRNRYLKGDSEAQNTHEISRNHGHFNENQYRSIDV